MANPGIITGGFSRLFARGDVNAGVSRGVFAKYPGATPKYALNRGVRDAEYRESMARLFIELPPGTRDSFIESLPEETRELGRVLAVGGGEVGGGEGTGFVDFLITNAQEPMQEKEQIVDTLTDNYVAFYAGQAAPQFNYTGMVLNTYQDDQRVWLLKLYRDVLRGTRLANRGLIARLRYDSFIVSGYLNQLTLGLNADAQTAGSFSFGIRVKSVSVFTPSLGSPTILQTPATSNILLAQNSEPASATDRVALRAPESVPDAVRHPAAHSDAEQDPRTTGDDPARSARNNAENSTRDGQHGLSNVRGQIDQDLMTRILNADNQAALEAALERRRLRRRRGTPLPPTMNVPR